jgi:hypothetical protein
MINIVCDFNSINSDLHTDILFYLGNNYVNLTDITISDRPFQSVKNLFYINEINSPLIELLNDFYDINLIQNNFYLQLDVNSRSDIIKKIFKFKPIQLNNSISNNFYKKNKINKKFTFHIRKGSQLLLKFECFLKILSIFYEFYWSINDKIPNSVDVHVLTPVQDDISGISITQLIMSYQKNQYPISNINEKVFDGLYIPYDFTLESIESLLLNLDNNAFDLESFKNKFNDYDFSNLFK